MLLTYKIELRIKFNHIIKLKYIRSTYKNNLRLWRKTHCDDRRK